jgi:hypothetical protein
MSLPKFLSLLNEQALYFARHNTFFDAQEGFLSKPDRTFLDSKLPDISTWLGEDHLGCTYINCWVISDVELYLMWTAYSSINEGISIKTTIGNLIDSLDPKDERDIYISDVEYIDHDTQYTFGKAGGFTNLIAPFFCKGKYFQQEKELRLIYTNNEIKYKDDIYGLQFKVSLDTLIDEIWIAPKATNWFENLVQDEMILHNLNKPLKRSHIKTWNKQ